MPAMAICTDLRPKFSMVWPGIWNDFATFVTVVDDVEATSRAAEAAGGKVLMPAQSIGGGHLYAQIADPSGNQIGLINKPPEI